jgi:hypothetical protein
MFCDVTILQIKNLQTFGSVTLVVHKLPHLTVSWIFKMYVRKIKRMNKMFILFGFFQINL